KRIAVMELADTTIAGLENDLTTSIDKPHAVISAECVHTRRRDGFAVDVAALQPWNARALPVVMQLQAAVGQQYTDFRITAMTTVYQCDDLRRLRCVGCR